MISTASVYNFNPVSDPPAGVNDVGYINLIMVNVKINQSCTGCVKAADWNIDPITLQPIERQYNKRTLADNSIADTSFSYAPINFFNER